MKTKLTDLTEHLFEMVEKLNDDDFCENETNVKVLIDRAKVVADLSSQIISIQDTQLKALEIAEKCGYTLADMPNTLALEHKGK